MAVHRAYLPALLIGALALVGCTGAAPTSASTSAATARVATVPATSTAAARSAAASTPTSVLAPWPGYHANNARTAAIGAANALKAPITKSWGRSLGAAVYGQPVVANGEVIAAAENNRVAALNARTGKVIWSHSIGTPLTNVRAVAGCGDIDPLGITSTPAVDATRGEVFVVGEVVGSTGVHHRLVGFSIRTGKVLLREFVDPPLPKGEKRQELLQRPGLAISKGRVYIAYGGNAGDCGDYHGWLLGVKESGAPHMVSFMATPGSAGGAIWQSGGAPAVDAEGNVYVATGNSNPWPGSTDPGKYAESLVKLSPALKVLHVFKDTAATGDADLSTANPVLLSKASVYTVGKTDAGYIVTSAKLALHGKITGVCGSDPDGGSAYDRATKTLFTPCRGGGIEMIDVAHRKVLRKLQGPNGAPILVGNQLWAVAYNSGALYEFNAKTGALVRTLAAGAVPTFASPSAAGGRLYLGTSKGVVAFG